MLKSFLKGRKASCTNDLTIKLLIEDILSIFFLIYTNVQPLSKLILALFIILQEASKDGAWHQEKWKWDNKQVQKVSLQCQSLVLSMWGSLDYEQNGVWYFSDGTMSFQRDALPCMERALVQTATCRIVISINTIIKELQNWSPMIGCVCSLEKKQYLSEEPFFF